MAAANSRIPPRRHDDSNDLPSDAFDDDVEIEVVPRIYPFVMLDKRLTENPELSYRAKGVAAYMMGKPPGWKFNIKDIMNHGTEGRDAIYVALKELRDHGYAEYRRAIPKVRKALWRISDARLSDIQALAGTTQGPVRGTPRSAVPDAKSPRPEKPDTGKPDTAFQDALVRRKVSNTTPSETSADADASAPAAYEDEWALDPEEEGFKNLEADSSEPAEPSEEFAARLARLHERAKARKPKPSDWQKLNGAAISMWNQHKRPEWVAMTAMTPRERKLLAELYEFAGNEFGPAITMLRDGLVWAASNEEWAEGKRLAFGELLANDKVISYSQKMADHRARGGSANQAVGSGPGGTPGGAPGGTGAFAPGSYARFQGGRRVYIEAVQGVQRLIAEVLPTGEPDLDNLTLVYQDDLTPIFDKSEEA